MRELRPLSALSRGGGPPPHKGQAVQFEAGAFAESSEAPPAPEKPGQATQGGVLIWAPHGAPALTGALAGEQS